VGKANSLLKPAYYVMIFSSFDLIALVIQAIGGAGASEAEQKGTNTTPSTHIMVFHSDASQLIYRKRVLLFKAVETLFSAVSH
jgi:hypothetical protein